MSHPGRLRRHEGMRIAIVGGTGTLGGHFATELRSRGHEIRILSRSAPEYRQAEVHGSFSFAAWLEAGAVGAGTARGGPEPR